MLLSDIIFETFDPLRVLGHIRVLSGIHRITASNGYESACDYVERMLRSFGLHVERLRFPAREGAEFLGYRSVEKWIIRDAKLEIIYPGEKKLREFGLEPTLADFKLDPLSVIQRSAPTPPEGIECELIAIEDGYDSESYPRNTRGNIVLVREEPDKVRALAVEKFGAIGIVTDRSSVARMRDPDLADARLYQSFWWFGGERKVFGFVITPRQGSALRRLLRESKVVVRAYVDSEFVSDSFSVVSGLIEGEEDEEIWVLSHLDHPSPGAEDNASGVGVSLEIARTLMSLMNSGRIPRFKRGIRFLYMSEFMGTAAYVAHRYEDIRSGKIIGAVNLDMVGADEKYGGALLIIEPPYEMASYVAPLMRWLMNYLISTDSRFAGADDVALFRWGISKFSAGSDYYILTDPIVGISTVALNRWPYKYYHTSKDTPEKISAECIRRVGVLASVFVSILATVNSEGIDWLSEITKSYYQDLLAGLTLESWTRVLGDYKMRLFKSGGFPRRETLSRALGLLNLITRAGKKALMDLRKNIGQWWDYENDLRELERKAMESMRKIKEIFGLYADRESLATLRLDDKYRSIVPERTGKLFDPEGQMAPLTYEKMLEWEKVRSSVPRYKYYPILDITLFKVDGKKTLEQIVREIYYEFGVWAPDGILRFFRFLESIGVVRLRTHS